VEIDLHASDGFHNRRSVSHPVFSSEPSYASPLYLTGPAVNEQHIPQECNVTNTSPNTVRLQNLRDALPEFVMTLGSSVVHCLSALTPVPCSPWPLKEVSVFLSRLLSGGYTMMLNGTGLFSWPELALGHLEGPRSFFGCPCHTPGNRRRHGP